MSSIENLSIGMVHGKKYNVHCRVYNANIYGTKGYAKSFVFIGTVIILNLWSTDWFSIHDCLHLLLV